MTITYNIRPLSYTNFTNREFESLMIDTSQVLEDFTKSHKDETMYGKHLDSFKSKLSDYQAQLASVEKKETTSLTIVDKERDSALIGLFTLIEDLLKSRKVVLRKPMRYSSQSLLSTRISPSTVTM